MRYFDVAGVADGKWEGLSRRTCQLGLLLSYPNHLTVTQAANQTLSLPLLLMSAMADCLTDVDAVITADLIQCETCNPAGVGFAG